MKISMSSLARELDAVMNANIDNAFKVYHFVYGSIDDISIMERNPVSIERALDKAQQYRGFIVKNTVLIEKNRVNVREDISKGLVKSVEICADYARAFYEDNLVYERAAKLCEEYANSVSSQKQEKG